MILGKHNRHAVLYNRDKSEQFAGWIRNKAALKHLNVLYKREQFEQLAGMNQEQSTLQHQQNQMEEFRQDNAEVPGSLF